MDTTTVTATQIMTAKLISTSPETHVLNAIDLLTQHQVSALPVVGDSGKYLGRFSDRSAISALDLGVIKSHSAVCRRMMSVCASDVVNFQMPVLHANQDAFECIGQLVSQQVSGAPVVDSAGRLCGVFSEQSAMHIYIGLCWEQLPSANVSSWLDRHDDRRINQSTPLNEILERFQNTPYRRLMVVDGADFVGQVTRQDALLAAVRLSDEPMALCKTQEGERQVGLKTNVSGWMQPKSGQLSEHENVLKITEKFLRLSARQLPVIKDERLCGQVSRSDLLRAVQHCFPEPKLSKDDRLPLYISSLNRQVPTSIS